MTTRATGRAVGALLLALAAAPAAAAETEAGLTGYDVLTPPGREVRLRAKLEREGVMGINPDVADASLDYYLVSRDAEDLEEPKYLGSEKTNEDGTAALGWTAAAPGEYVIEARVRPGSEYVALPARIRVAAPPPDRPILLVQLDETVSKATNLKMFRGTENAKISAVEGAREILQLLSGRYQLVYLTDLEVAFTSKFKDWIQLRDLPPAPVIFWELFNRSLSHATYMDKRVAKLRQEFPQLEVGVGGGASDGRAFVDYGLAGIVLDPDAEELGEAVIRAVDWRHVQLHVAQLQRTEGLLRQMVEGDAQARQDALAQLSLLGPVGVGYVHRFRSASDLDLAAAATEVAAKLRALEAFAGALDLSSANAALASLVAAWRHGEPAVVAALFDDREMGLAQPIPQFARTEMITRTQPVPDKVVFRVRLVGEETRERELTFAREEGLERWRVVAAN